MRLLNTSLGLCVAAMVFSSCASSPDHKRHRNSFDTDSDGYLTPEEYSASELSRVLKFEELDRDENGLLSEAELRFDGAMGGRKGGRRGENRGPSDRMGLLGPNRTHSAPE